MTMKEQLCSKDIDLLTVSGECNHSLLSATLPNFTQYLDCHTKGITNSALAICKHQGCIQLKNPPPMGCFDHKFVHLLPHIHPVGTETPQRKTVKVWTEEAKEQLRDCFDTLDWNALCSPHWVDINSVME